MQNIKEINVTGAREILVVEDDPDVSNLLAYRLTARGFHVRRMDRGIPILRMLQEHRPVMVVLDIMLPDIDGIQICRMMKASDKYADIPVVILTARGDEHAAFEALHAGADLFLKKNGFLKSIDSAVDKFLH